MESNQSTRLGAKRSAIPGIGQVSQRQRWIDLAPENYGEGQFHTPSGQRYAFLVVDKDHSENHALPEDA